MCSAKTSTEDLEELARIQNEVGLVELLGGITPQSTRIGGDEKGAAGVTSANV
jgi:hypothetical protein